jgi:ligand-binding sensor protein
MTLTGLAPWEAWVAFERDFNERSGMNCCSIDEEGVRVTAYKAWANRLCPVIRGSPRSARAICEDQTVELLEHAKSGTGAEVAACKAGLVRVFVPVRVKGRLLGMVGGCGLLPQDGEVNTIAISSTTGLGKDKIAALRRDIGRISPGEIEALVHHLEGEIQEIALQLEKKIQEGGVRYV